MASITKSIVELSGLIDRLQLGKRDVEWQRRNGVATQGPISSVEISNDGFIESDILRISVDWEARYVGPTDAELKYELIKDNPATFFDYSVTNASIEVFEGCAVVIKDDAFGTLKFLFPGSELSLNQVRMKSVEKAPSWSLKAAGSSTSFFRRFCSLINVTRVRGASRSEIVTDLPTTKKVGNIVYKNRF